MDLTTANLTELNTSYETRFNGGRDGYTPTHPRIAATVPSNGSKNLYPWLTAITGMKEFKGEVERDPFQLSSWEIENKEFYDVKSVPRTAILDDEYGVYAPLMAEMGEAGQAHPDVLLSQLFLNAFTEKDYTGKAFFAADKNFVPGVGKAGKFTNFFTKQLTADYFNDARAALVGLKGPNGVTINRTLNLVLVTGPELTKDALEIVKATTVEAGGQNVQAGMATHVEFPMLGDSPYWALLNVGHMTPFMVQDREGLSFTSMTRPDDPNVFNYHQFDYKSYRRFNVGFGLPQRAYGSTGADA